MAGRSAAATTPAQHPDKKTFTVAVLGDGFAQALTEGLQLNAAAHPDMTILDKTHAPFGLSQADQFEWPIAVRNLFAGSTPIDAAVVLLGANDTMPLKEGTETIAPGTPRWTQVYGDRVATVAGLFRDKGIPLTWVGLPIVQDERLSANFVALNEIARDRAAKAGATYVDSWEAFVDEAGKYSQSGPDLNGKITRLRTGDGIDFTPAGERKLASFIEPELKRDRDKARTAAAVTAVTLDEQPGFDNALQVDVNAQIRREVGLPALAPEPGAAGQTGKAQIGPIVAITAPAVAADGRLADPTTDPGATLGAGGGSLVQRALVEGQPIQPRPGRTDDFSWPKH